MTHPDHHRRPPTTAPRPGVRRDTARLVLVLAAGLLGAGCSGGEAAPRTPSPSTPSSTSSPSSTTPTTPQQDKHTLAELARRPCLALDARDLDALGITGPGEEEPGENGPSCLWRVGGQNVNLRLDVPASYAQTMTEGGRVSRVRIGRHTATQAEFHRICFTFVEVDGPDHLVGSTTIPEPDAPQSGACPAGLSVVASALTHIG
ncbi:DUF3558 family protein [Saccharothrix hoggarensis]|uniref:DUF3558 family protein n=1 Tax=Saccharothrix hoggarensis TaxID=913853 RepID=A0ABW3R664_9PSEU